MLQDFTKSIPPDIIKFLLVLIFSLLIGLEQRRQHIKDKIETRFGTDRTFTLIGIFGFILFTISPQNLIPFLGGGIILGLLLGLYYLQKMRVSNEFGLTSLIIALITYCLAPLIYTQSSWMVLLIVVSVLILTEIKKSLIAFSKKFDENEFTTLAKFLVIAGVVLPLLPNATISPSINISPYKFWLAIVAVSGISYFSYLLKKFVFPKSGILLTGILGGLYSSTATTVILARKSQEMSTDSGYSSAIILATTMMYLRIFLLALFFNGALALSLAPPFTVLVLVSVLVALYFSEKRIKEIAPTNKQLETRGQNNPLEFKTSLLFGGLFILFAWITGYIDSHYGDSGIEILSFLVGVTDIDPFIINLLQNKLSSADNFLVIAIVNATTSNNLLKMIYGVSLSNKLLLRPLIIAFSILILVGLIISFVFL